MASFTPLSKEVELPRTRRQAQSREASGSPYVAMQGRAPASK